jgi:hypothetical protein
MLVQYNPDCGSIPQLYTAAKAHLGSLLYPVSLPIDKLGRFKDKGTCYLWLYHINHGLHFPSQQTQKCSVKDFSLDQLQD